MGLKLIQRKYRVSWIFGKPTMNIKSWVLMGMIQCYSSMWQVILHLMYLLIKVYSIPKVIIILWNNKVWVSFTHINQFFSAESLLSYLWCTIMFTVYIDASDEQLGDAISKYDKLIVFLSVILKKSMQI